MVSARANEYITRFSKGVQKTTALEKIVEYRDECKGLYHAAESKNPMNYRAAEDKRIYLEDMFERIHVLGEARDYLQKEINKKAPTKANNMRSAVAFVPEKENKSKPARKTKEPKSLYEVNELKWGHERPDNAPSRCDIESASIHVDSRSYFMRTAGDKALCGKSENFIKYVLRFQHLGLPSDLMETASACLVIEAIENYIEEWDTESSDREYAKRAKAALKALDDVKEYFEEIDEFLNTSKMEADGEKDDDEEYDFDGEGCTDYAEW
jgi:CRISPR/Cas system CMR-associated protein Cmr5 small subunit